MTTTAARDTAAQTTDGATAAPARWHVWRQPLAPARPSWFNLGLLALALAGGADGALAGVDRCTQGRAQSPAAITADALDAPRLPSLRWGSQAQPLVLANDGHTLRVRLARGGWLQLDGQRYTLQQFHFHTPGGESLLGQSFAFSAHVLFKGPKGDLLAMTLPFVLGAEHPVLTRLWAHIPPPRSGDQRVPGQTVDLAELLPAQGGYYRYVGSLTDTPCTEGVTWLVRKQPLHLSAAQLATWRQHFADNMRAPQPLHTRRVQQTTD